MKNHLLIIGLVIAFSLAGSLLLAQTTRYVNPDGNCGGNSPCYTTIQAAINASNSGDIIEVAAGNYNERLNISKSLTIKGAQYGVDPTPSGVRTNPSVESVIDLTGLPVANPNVLIEIPSGVTNVTLDGFTLIGSPSSHYADEAVIRCWDDNLTISNNIVDGFYGILSKGADYLTVHSNRIKVNKAGITIQPNTATNAALTNNTIAIGTSPASDAQGIYLTATSNAAITGNTITGFIGSRGIGGSNLTNITLSNNTITGNRDGISFWGTTTFITINDNDLSNSTRYGINIKGQDIEIKNNEINNCGDTGIYIAKDVIATQRVNAHHNNISGNTNYGIFVHSAVLDTVIGENNWWGDSSGPEDKAGSQEVIEDYNCGEVYVKQMLNNNGLGDKVSDQVDYCPWADALIPVELLTFVAYSGNEQVILAWSTATETENLGFHLFRSLDVAKDYQQITTALIKGSGSSAEAHSYTYTDRNVQPGQTYYYKLADVDFAGNLRFHGPISVTVDAVPSSYSLSQNYPNPFNPETAIHFSLKEAGKVTLKIYNLQGQLVRTLVDEEKSAGSYSILWNGTADNGLRLASGMYYYAIQVNGFEQTKKLLLMK